MNHKEAKEMAKGMLKSYLESQGINTNKLFRCLSAEHSDVHASMSYNERTNTCRCFACGEHGDIFDVIRMQYGIPKEDYARIFETTYRVLGINVDSYSRSDKKNMSHPPPIPYKKDISLPEKPELELGDFFRTAEGRLQETAYPKKRGLTEDVMKRFHVGFDPAWVSPLLDEDTRKKVKPSPRLIIPTSSHSYLARDTRMHLTEAQKRYSKMKVGRVCIFNAEAFHHATQPVFLVEGEIDAMSIIVAGGEAGALGSTSNCELFLKECKNHPPKAPVIICADNDQWGKKAMARLTAGLMSMGIPFLFANPSGKWKDANERLMNDPKGLRQSVTDALLRADEMQSRLFRGGTPDELVDSMRQKLVKMREEKADPWEFWQDAFAVIDRTISEVQQTRGALRILRVMAAGVSAMEEQFGRNTPREIVEIRRKAENALRNTDKNELGWEAILALAETTRALAKNAMEAIQKDNRRNPLLSIPSIRDAHPLPLDTALKGVSPKELYAMAVKRAVLDDDAVGIYEADRKAAMLLHENGIEPRTIQACLLHSPRILHLKANDKAYETQAFLRGINGKLPQQDNAAHLPTRG